MRGVSISRFGIMASLWRPFSESWMAWCSSGSRANVADVLFHKKSIKIRFPSENRIIPHVNIYIYLYMTIYDNLFFIQWYEISNADFLPMFWMFLETLLRLAEWQGTHYLGFLQCIQLNEVRSCFRFGQIFVAHTNLLSNPWVICLNLWGRAVKTSDWIND